MLHQHCGLSGALLLIAIMLCYINTALCKIRWVLEGSLGFGFGLGRHVVLCVVTGTYVTLRIYVFQCGLLCCFQKKVMAIPGIWAVGGSGVVVVLGSGLWGGAFLRAGPAVLGTPQGHGDTHRRPLFQILA